MHLPPVNGHTVIAFFIEPSFVWDEVPVPIYFMEKYDAKCLPTNQGIGKLQIHGMRGEDSRIVVDDTSRHQTGRMQQMCPNVLQQRKFGEKLELNVGKQGSSGIVQQLSSGRAGSLIL